ncbi:MAG: PAQR family membrane homeostasis protein TrhA [Myxococcota bacterium]
MTRSPPMRRPKPRLRGVSHEIVSAVAFAVAVWLVASAPTSAARVAGAVYGFSLAALFTVSAVYHRPTWSPPARRWMRRLDHAAIYVLIAGSYTPIAMLVVPEEQGRLHLWITWSCAFVGVLQSLLWVHAPKALSAILYLAMGWIALLAWEHLLAGVGLSGVVLLLAGGVAYTAGAVIYALKRPDPWPATFGYHEIFHLLVIVAAALHFVVLAPVVLSAG